MASPVTVSRIQNRRGTQAQFDALYPPGYTGVGPVDINLYPNILMPGELALCTDTRRIFLGNLTGEYVEIASVLGGGILLAPFVMQLLPTVVFPAPPIFTPIPALNYLATPFFTLLYDVTDSLNPDWNTVGTTFSRNGEMKITATVNTGPGSVSLVDTSSDVNTTLFDISFTADYNGPNIEISYSHDFPGSLTFSSSTILWLPI
jgi:hypothetical protein